MSQSGAPSLRIDWFDGSLVEDARPSTSASEFADEEQTSAVKQMPAETERKPIGFKRLLDISLMESDKLTMEVAYRPGFWNLFDQEELKGDFIVLLVNILGTIFRTIKLGGTSSKLIKSLETRFLSTNFLDKLTCYVESLPNVKIVDKRMNMQLWDDVEAFFFNVASLCEGIASFVGKKDKAVHQKLNKLLKVLCISAIGVIQQHTENIRDDLFEEIIEIQKVIKNYYNLVSNEVNDTPSMDSFRNLNIFPTLYDLLTPAVIARRPELTNLQLSKNDIVNKTLKIKPILAVGVYPSVEDYLDLQFRLLREDYLGPLREGISAYLENPSKKKHENIIVYNNVRILSTVVKNNKVGHLVDFAWNERNDGKKNIKEAQNKKLMYGSLLLFTCDEFRTIFCATVMHYDPKSKNGHVLVSFHNPVSKNIFSQTYLMIESEVFFEPYHQVLKVLQSSELNNLPMKKYIVDVKQEPNLPAYLTPETKYTIETPNKLEIDFLVMDLNNWPKKYINLDGSQLEAYKFALTREFAVIQGPPGTGKTFIGVKIACTILKNLSLKDTPMLVICYTNHALDQFLEGILKYTKSIIRLGSQSKSEKLEPYIFSNVKAKIDCKNPFFKVCKKKLEYIYQEMVQLQTKIERCDTEILSYDIIKPFLMINSKRYRLPKLKGSIEDRVSYWLFEHLEYSKKLPEQGKNYCDEESWEEMAEFSFDANKIKGVFSEKNAQEQIDMLDTQLRFQWENGDNAFSTEPFLIKKELLLKRLDYFKRKIMDYQRENKMYTINNVSDLYDLSTEKRWQMYFNAVNRVKDELHTKMDVLLDKHNAANLELEELSALVDSKVARSARVLGVTTSGAARRHRLLKEIRSPIVIVEEAAEVLEAHIIASLTSSLQHLILIGDHKQLRPSAANYRLAKECNIEVSLFERMIMNKVHARTLTSQRRMRTEFTDLLVPHIYPVLENHESVLKYPNVNGMTKNLYFLNHKEWEKAESSDSSSHENRYEAIECVDLAGYLLKHGYVPDDVTLLTTYTAQVSLMQKLWLESQSNSQELQNLKITTVDNFQGEESRIVILSLVRSNRENKIGFLAETNRICVALSRAKEGFYIIGNLDMFAANSKMWMTIKGKLESQEAFGDKWPKKLSTPKCLKPAEYNVGVNH